MCSAALGKRHSWWVEVRCTLTQLEAPGHQQRAPLSAPEALRERERSSVCLRDRDERQTSRVCRPNMADQMPDLTANSSCPVYHVPLKQRFSLLYSGTFPA